MLDLLRNQLTITLQNTVGTLGPMPNETGDEIKKMLSEDDDCAMMALGCYLDDCIKYDSYIPVIKGVKSIRKSQAERAE